ncbi:hypothetical protein M4951_01820 [Blastopirellula sp. J2-11]|uniref:hypothetical protein n=1 Tax=Blastopirellula sp. J2-11 TaxID=2943192 RepID=UPI0021C906A6|nr:hypothetical protein [Blastopirellula sp. J2-11]UUO07062.1 hypothetical protein M4951_01820 [Blastopirellula sp. J2-11]
MNKREFAWLLAAICVACSACSSKPAWQETPVYPTSGSVSVKGKSAYGAVVIFHPQGDVGMTKGNKPYAKVAEDGSFEVTTYVSGDGAPAGEYVITIIWPKNPNARGPSPDRLRGRYAIVEKSELKASIQAGDNLLPQWDL